jgi:protein required for attachment to host cells
VGYLEKAHQQGKFGELCIVAAPEFLGEIRGVMNKSLHGTVKLEIDKDYSHADARELGERLARRMQH